MVSKTVKIENGERGGYAAWRWVDEPAQWILLIASDSLETCLDEVRAQLTNFDYSPSIPGVGQPARKGKGNQDATQKG